MIDLFGETLTLAELLQLTATAIPYLIIYFITGFGPGLVLGILIMNWLAGRGYPVYMDLHQENIKKAADHNAQWNPRHDRWKK